MEEGKERDGEMKRKGVKEGRGIKDEGRIKKDRKEG